MTTYAGSALERIFYRTDGLCHICHRRMCFSNYGLAGRRGAWEIEHSVARANGGSDHLNNLYGAHIACNRSKGTCSSRTARAWNGCKRAPLSAQRKEKARWGNAAIMGTIGGIATLILAPEIALLGAGAAAVFGYNLDPNKV